MFRQLFVSLTIFSCAQPTWAQDGPTIEHFEKKVRPILIDHCQECHGADGKKIKGGLRLLSREDLLRGGDSGPAIVSGEPDKSRLITAVRFHDEDLKMPPKGKLSATQIADLETWVRAGAPWPGGDGTTARNKPGSFTDAQLRHWSFQPIVDPKVPAVGVNNGVDAFIVEKLRARGLALSPAASKYQLLRRVTFDLTGLPPALDHITSFMADDRPDAFERVVDRLLASPAYGERWGRHWLDLARYADSNGLDENTAFGNAWRYRDYVIRSFNSDKPYDEFVREQIAGDLFPDATSNPDRLTALGFLAIGPKLLAEPDKQKMKLDIADEQLDTIGKAMLGLTIGCARCHDHKFDPLSQREYYSLLSIFTSTRTMKDLATVAQAHERALPTSEPVEVQQAREAKLAQLQKQVDESTKQLRALVISDARAKLAEYLLAGVEARGPSGAARMSTGLPIPGAIVREAEKYQKGSADKDDQTYGKDIGIILSYNPANNFAEYAITVPKAGEYDLELRYAALESRSVKILVGGKVVIDSAAKCTSGGWGPESQSWHAEGRLHLAEGKNVVAIQALNLLPHIDKLAILPIQKVESKTGPRPSRGSPEDVARQRKLVVEFVRAWAERLASATSDDPLFGPLVAVANLADDNFVASAKSALQPHRGKPGVDRLIDSPGNNLAEFVNQFAKYMQSIYTGKKFLASANNPFTLKTPLPTSPEALYPEQVAKISELSSEQAALRKQAPAKIMVLAVDEGAKYPQVRADGQPRNLFVQVRGNYLTPGEEAPPVFPAALGKADPFAQTTGAPPTAEKNQTRYGAARSRSGRWELANWIASPRHPLTARVIVNRVWQHHFGEGLVRSPDNFGLLGEKPSHPELLDWLAARFIEDGWSLKSLHRRILLTDTYQQGSSNLNRDRELVIDPDNRLLWRFHRRRLEAEPIRDALLAVAGNGDWTMGGTLLNNGNFTYVNNENSTNTARYDNRRRSVYLPVIRNSVFDFFQSFDFAEPHVSNGKRASTVVAPQALFMMNNKFVMSQAGELAKALLGIQGDDSDRVRRAHLLVYARPATDDEVSRLLGYLARYEAALATEKSTPTDRRQMAWKSTCQLLLASNEFIYVD